MAEIQQSDFKFNLEDKVVIVNPAPLYEDVRGKHGYVTHRGYQDTVSPRDLTFPNLYCIFVYGEGSIPGVAESWLEHEDSSSEIDELRKGDFS